ncbi:MAG: EamA family transporter [Methanolobus sp.]|nr:EamA family transporter [Methanolobus sp.]
MNPGSKKPYVELITGSVLFGLMGVFVFYLQDIPTGPLIFYKQLFGIIALFLFMVITGKLSRIIPRKKKRYLLLLGIINTTTLFAYLVCIRYTSFSVAILMLYTAPMYVTLLSPMILKESIRRNGIIALVLSLIGLLFIVDINNIAAGQMIGSWYLIGVAAGILSGFSFGSSIVVVRYVKDEYTGMTLIFWYTLIGVILLLPFAGGVPVQVFADNLSMLVLFGVVNTTMAALLFINGISQIEAQKGSILALIEPVSGIFFDYTILQTPLIANTIIGCIFILLGAYIAITEKSPRRFGKYFRVQV